MLRYLTAGESHGEALMAIIDGMPAGLRIDKEKINAELKRRQSGYGRGLRMQIEEDRAQIISGLRQGKTLGSPIGILIKNKDFSIDNQAEIFNPRPGHADLAGLLKYGFNGARGVLERASARETAAKTAVGALCKIFLAEFGITVDSKVLNVGGKPMGALARKIIDEAIRRKDSLGGIFEIVVTSVPCGLGSYAQGDRRLGVVLAGALMSVPGIKGIEFGLGFGYGDKSGSQAHDVIYFSRQSGYYRKTNNAGGIEGGISNGEPIVIRVCMKPIATLNKPLGSIDIRTKKVCLASVQRADICAVEAAGVVAEGVIAFELANCMLEKFGADCLSDIKQAVAAYKKRIKG